MNEWPKYQFASLCGPVDTWFAWLPVKTWYGKIVWLRKVKRRAAVVHSFLSPGGGDIFWCYIL